MPTTSTTPQHAPTPWKVDSDYPLDILDANGLDVATTSTPFGSGTHARAAEHADLIVRAVNSRAALVEALEKLIAWEDRRRERVLSVGAQIARSADYDSARAALAAAKGKP